MKKDINDVLQAEGTDAARTHHDRTRKYDGPNNRYAKRRTFVLKPFESITLLTTPNYLVKGFMPRTGLAVIWGPPKCGKSFWTFDLMMHVVLGWKYRDRKVQQGAVVYLALEGGHGFRARVEAWRRRHLNDHRGKVPFYLLDVPLDLVADHVALIQAIKSQLSDQAPAAVVIDTLNRALVGDENKPADMAKFVRAADAIRIAFECLVAIVHHCGVAGGRPRGHSSLPGADDVQIGVERDDNTGISTAKVDHAKDMEAGATVVFRLEREVLGIDQDGDEITSCVVVPVDGEAAAKRPKLVGQAKVALDLLTELLADAGEPAPTSNHVPRGVDKVCSSVLWRETFYKSHIGDSPDTKRKAFDRATSKLQEMKLIGIWSDKVWLANYATGQNRQVLTKPALSAFSGTTEKFPGHAASDMAGHHSSEKEVPVSSTLQRHPDMPDMAGQTGNVPATSLTRTSDTTSLEVSVMSGLSERGDDAPESKKLKGTKDGGLTPEETRARKEIGLRPVGPTYVGNVPVQFIGPEPDHPCVQCGCKDGGQVYLIRSRGVESFPLHEACAPLWFLAADRFRIIGQCAPETVCLKCRETGDVLRLKDTRQPGSQSETLHLRCAETWFDELTSQK